MDDEERAERLEHDLEALRGEAVHVGERAAVRIAPFVIGTVVLAALAWLVGRRLRDRAARRA
jgi:hypothetical protein